MNFKKVLLEKNLKIEELSEKLQRKIKEIENVTEELATIESTVTEADTDELEQITMLKFKINALDADLVSSLKKFDPAKYLQRRERMRQINDEKYGRAPKSEPEEREEPQSEVAPEVFEEKAVVAPEQFELESVPPISKTQHIKEELEKLSETVEVNPQSFDQSIIDEKVIEVEPEVEEFDKADDTKPRKMSKGLILMGVGAFLLTWGAVNFFRERRG